MPSRGPRAHGFNTSNWSKIGPSSGSSSVVEHLVPIQAVASSILVSRSSQGPISDAAMSIL